MVSSVEGGCGRGRSLSDVDVMCGADEGVVERKKVGGGARSGRSLAIKKLLHRTSLKKRLLHRACQK